MIDSFQENVAKEKAAKDTNKKVGKRKRDNGKKSNPAFFKSALER